MGKSYEGFRMSKDIEVTDEMIKEMEKQSKIIEDGVDVPRIKKIFEMINKNPCGVWIDEDE